MRMYDVDKEDFNKYNFYTIQKLVNEIENKKIFEGK